MNGPSRPDTGVGQPGNSDDRLLGGRLRLSQPKQGYRVAIDPILLAAAIDATAGERILDAGCGTGAAALCLAMRALECTMTGVERDAELAALACSNVAINGLNGRIAVVECALEDYAGAFDQVMTNPPFHESDTHTRSPQLTKASAHGETALDLAGWIEASARLLKPGGRLTLIHRADRLGDILQAFEGRFGAAAIDSVLAFVSAGQGARAATLDRLANVIGGSAEGDEGLEELARIGAALAAFGIGEDQALFDPSVVRGLEYYTGVVFEAELLAQGADDAGEPMRFGSIGGGGRYDDLVARFTGERTPATGFSFGVSRLAAALAATGRAEEDEARGPVVVIAFDAARMSDYFAAAAELRAGGLAAEVYLGGSGMRAQMKYADRRLSPAAVILGEDEIAAGQVTVKDLDLGRELAAAIKGHESYREARPGQVTAPRAELVATVRAIVERAR